jgi:hypothetical protein
MGTPDPNKVLLLPWPDLATRLKTGDLQYADLTDVKNLLPFQIAGADLTG